MRGVSARWLLRLFLTVLTAVAGCVQAPPTLSPTRTVVPRGGVVLPVKRISDLMLIEVQVNGHGPFNFLVDTGSGTMIVSSHLADTLSEFASDSLETLIGATGEPVAVTQLFHIERLEAGDVTFEQFDAVVVNLDAISGALGTVVDGIAGFPLFADCLLTIDHSGNTIAITEGSLPEVDGIETLDFVLESFRPSVSIEVGDEELYVVLDSGASSALVLPPDALGLKFEHGPVPSGIGTTIAGTSRSAIGRLVGSLQIGGFVINRPVVVLIEGEPLIGADLMKHFVTTFDSRSRRVRFVRSSDAPIATAPVRTTGVSFGMGPVGWEVSDIIPETPAEAVDLKLGDRLVSFADQPAESFTHNSWRQLAAEFDSVRVVVQREGWEIEMDLPVVELVP